MKLCAIFLIALFVIKSSNCADIKLVAQAICGIIEEAFIKKSVRIEIVSVAFGFKSKMDIIDEVLRLQQETEDFPVEMRHIDLTKNWDHHKFITKSAIFFLDSPEAFFVINSTMELRAAFPKTFRILLYNEELAEKLIEKTVAKKLILSKSFEKISFLKSQNGFIELNAITAFAPGTCNKFWSSVIINQFSESSQTWKTKDFFITTIENFYGCELKVQLNAAFVKNHNGTEFLTDSLQLLAILSKQLNFTYSFQDSHANLLYAFVSYNYLLESGHLEKYHITTSFMSFHYIVFTTLGELYTPLEKLFFPFYKEVWIGIGVVFLMAFILIFVVNHAPLQLRHFMLGRRARVPAINMVIDIIGGAPVIQPRRNWTRILLAVYLLMCFFMQNVYQNKMFDFMVGDGRKPPPKSLEDLVAKNYTIFLQNENAFMIERMEPSKRPRISKISFQDLGKVFFEMPKDPNFKGALMLYSEWFSNIKKENDTPWQQIDENILSMLCGLGMFAHDYYFDTFDQGIKKLLPSGLLNINSDPPKEPKTDDPPKVLSMKELAVAFKILFFGLAISFALFVLEHVKFYLFDRKREKRERKLQRRKSKKPR